MHPTSSGTRYGRSSALPWLICASACALARLISTITIDIIELTSFASQLKGRGDRADSEEGETGDKEGGAGDSSG